MDYKGCKTLDRSAGRKSPLCYIKAHFPLLHIFFPPKETKSPYYTLLYFGSTDVVVVSEFGPRPADLLPAGGGQLLPEDMNQALCPGLVFMQEQQH